MEILFNKHAHCQDNMMLGANKSPRISKCLVLGSGYSAFEHDMLGDLGKPSIYRISPLKPYSYQASYF